MSDLLEPPLSGEAALAVDEMRRVTVPTGLMEIKEYSSATNVNTTYYYKKGLGIVRFNSLVNSDLRAVTLN